MNDRLYTIPAALAARHGTRDPFRIARDLGHTVKFLDLKRQKGFCADIYNNCFIFISSRLSEQMKRMTCAHELGHIILHRRLLGRDSNGQFKKFIEMELFDIKDNTEYEANLFAADLLIDEEELYGLLKDGYDIVHAASSLDVNVNLLAIKLAEMNRRGLPVNISFTPDKGFIGRIEDRADSF